LALAKWDRLDEAIELLHRLYDADKPATDAETGGILAGRYKQRWLKSAAPEEAISSHPMKSTARPLNARRCSYPGINAAAMALALGDRTESLRIVHEIIPALKKVEVNKLDHWGSPPWRAYLLLSELEIARKWYGRR
jgi:hypothetical protein